MHRLLNIIFIGIICVYAIEEGILWLSSMEKDDGK